MTTKQQTTHTAAAEDDAPDRRQGVRRTVTVLVAIVLAFFALSFLQILLMK